MKAEKERVLLEKLRAYLIERYGEEARDIELRIELPLRMVQLPIRITQEQLDALQALPPLRWPDPTETGEDTMNDTGIIKEMTVQEFRELGVLQELNRLFLHPLGLALEVVIDTQTGEETLGKLWDYREDPEGLLFCEEVLSSNAAHKNAEYVQQLRSSKAEVRHKTTLCDQTGVQILPRRQE